MGWTWLALTMIVFMYGVRPGDLIKRIIKRKVEW